MPDRTCKRPKKANALAKWDNEGGAAKGAPQKDRDDMTSLAKEEEHILFPASIRDRTLANFFQAMRGDTSAG